MYFGSKRNLIFMPNRRKISKFLSYILRHNPGKIGLDLDRAGWASVKDLLEKASKHGMTIPLSQLRDVVYHSNKKRFTFSDDGKYIRANYGHSIAVKLGYEPK
jgi:putative RNA 2'-phosphotransferase